MANETEPTSKFRNSGVPVWVLSSGFPVSYTHGGKTWSELKGETVVENWAVMVDNRLKKKLSRMELVSRILEYSRQEDEASKEEEKLKQEFVVVMPTAALKKTAARAKTPAPKKKVHFGGETAVDLESL